MKRDRRFLVISIHLNKSTLLCKIWLRCLFIQLTFFTSSYSSCCSICEKATSDILNLFFEKWYEKLTLRKLTNWIQFIQYILLLNSGNKLYTITFFIGEGKTGIILMFLVTIPWFGQFLPQQTLYRLNTRGQLPRLEWVSFLTA